MIIIPLINRRNKIIVRVFVSIIQVGTLLIYVGVGV